MIQFIKNEKGPVIGYDDQSGVKIIEKDGRKFKNLSKSGEFLPYEDWRLSSEQRARDLAQRLSTDQIIGLMLYSSHQSIPGYSNPYFGEATYNGEEFQEKNCEKSDLTDQQKEFVSTDGVRHVLVGSVSSVHDAAVWNNNIQALAEQLPFGIPVNNCSDPRHGIDDSAEFNVGAGCGTSQWPEPIGLAASFNPAIVRAFGEIASKEYRALGLSTTLSPQCDLGTEPRWFRYSGTFGEGAELSADMTRAYCDGFQTSEGDAEYEDGWGTDSVNTMVKHWPGGGCGEAGRDAHYGCGKFGVYPGKNIEYQLKPFVEGAFQLEGKTKKASSVMPYYMLPFNQDKLHGENVGSGYSEYLVKDMLRERFGYDEVVCTDWNIIFDELEPDSIASGKCWGAEKLTVPERCLKIILAGVDQFGGLTEAVPVREAYRLGCEQYGETFMRQRFEQSAFRILKNIIRTGLFENPYLDVRKSEETVGQEKYVKAGYAAQLNSMVLLKNRDNVLPLKSGCKLYIPQRYTPDTLDWTGNPVPGKWDYPKGYELFRREFELVKTPEEADAALCLVEAPAVSDMMRGYDRTDAAKGGNGFVPISLQYRPYTAKKARQKSIAGEIRDGEYIDRSYYGKTAQTRNEKDLDMILDVRKSMGEKPVIVCVYTGGPLVVNEFEPTADGILINFNNTVKPLIDILTGRYEPSGLLPFQIPADMDAVEEQEEDVPFDMECHVDSESHVYDYAYGMNWKGVISDMRTKKYAPIVK